MIGVILLEGRNNFLVMDHLSKETEFWNKVMVSKS